MNNLNKNEIRKLLKKTHQNVSYCDIVEKSQIISKKIIELPQYLTSQCVALFCSFNNEFETKYLIEACLKDHKTIVVPKIVNNEMHFYEYGNLKLNAYGIFEPQNTKKIEKNEIDLMIVPYLGYNKAGYRIGYGKGFYDRYLADSNIFTILPALKAFEVEFIPDKYDVKINLVITEE